MDAVVAQSPVPEAKRELRPAAEYVPFVRRIALRLLRRLPSYVNLDDLVGAGLVGLLEARQRFDPSRAQDFESFAEFRVRGAMLDELRGRDLMARDARTEAKRIESCIEDLHRELGQPPDEASIARRLGLSVEALRAKQQKLVPVQVLSLTALGDSGDLPGRQPTPFDETARRQLIENLRDAITQLPERQQVVFHLYYQEELTMRDIGEVLGVTESRICQILSEGTLRLRALMRIEGAESGSKPMRRRR